MTEKEVYLKLISAGLAPAGACGLMGNWKAESGMNPRNLQNSGNKRLGMTDEEYTAAVDNASYTNFAHDGIGYGLAQWTYHTRKQALYDTAVSRRCSIGDGDMQVDYALRELRGYKAVWAVLTTTESVREASDIVLYQYEQPADQGAAQRAKRESYSMEYWNKYAKGADNMVMIGSARINEAGGTNGGQAGDQTGGEVSTQAWYLHGKGWKVLRPMDKNVAEKIARNMEAACANPNIGYCQDHRGSVIVAAKPYGYDAARIDKPVEADCGSLVRLCCLYAGVGVGDFYTGNEAAALVGTREFMLFEGEKYAESSDYLERGDILVTKTKGHTVVVLSDGAKVQHESKVTEGWQQAADGKRWWYRRADGTYPAGGWAYLREVTGGTSGWYLFDDEGYMLTGAQVAPDGKLYYLCDTPGIHEGQCMVTDEKGALMIAEWDEGAGRYKVG